MSVREPWFSSRFQRLESTLKGRAIIAGSFIGLALVVVVLRFTVFA